MEEYRRIGERLAAKFTGVSIESILALVATHATIVRARALPRRVCDDPDDDKFLACALAGRCRVVVSGDKGLLRVFGYRQIEVLTPRQFVDTYLKGQP
jgi:putative PIN family toxin of toxin-antitoxin system